MDYIDTISHLISEDEDKGMFDTCPECGHPFATIEGNECVCPSKNCANFDGEYFNMLMHLGGGLYKVKGLLRSKKGRDIPFIGIKDMGPYYVVYIPKEYTAFYKMYNKPKHAEFAEFEPKFPMFRAYPRHDEDPPYWTREEALERIPSAIAELEALNVPDVIINRLREKLNNLHGRPPYPMAIGVLKVKHHAKVITIKKENVESISPQ